VKRPLSWYVRNQTPSGEALRSGVRASRLLNPALGEFWSDIINLKGFTAANATHLAEFKTCSTKGHGQNLPQISPGHEKPPDIAFAREEPNNHCSGLPRPSNRVRNVRPKAVLKLALNGKISYGSSAG
jgi:hypothetical protein